MRSTPWAFSWPGSAEQKERDRLLGYMQERFGIPLERFDAYVLFQKGNAWWLLRRDPALCRVAGLKAVTAGLRAFSRVGRFVKPSTRMIQLFGRWATRGILPVDNSTHDQMVARRPLELVAPHPNLTDGYLILSYRGLILGLGLLIDGVLHPQLPRELLRPEIIPEPVLDPLGRDSAERNRVRD